MEFGISSLLLLLQMAANAEVHAVLQVCGITNVAQRNLLIQNEGFQTLEDISDMEGDQDVLELSKRSGTRTVGDGRVLLSTVTIKRLQGLVWWIHDRIKHQRPLVAADFTPDVMRMAMTRKRYEKQMSEATPPAVKDLGKFNPDDFDVQEDSFLNLLSQTPGVQKVNLRYVVRSAIVPAVFANVEQERLYQLPLQGDGFDQDNIKVYRLLKSFLVESPGWPWIEPFDTAENGREAFLAWTNHYNGQGELSKRVQLATAKIKQLHYKNERSLSFETFQSILTKCILTLGKSPEDALTPRKQVDTLLDRFKSTDPELIAAKAVVRQQYPRDFTAACNYLGSVIATVHGSSQLENLKWRQRKRNISGVETQGRGRGRARRGGRGRDGGRGGRGGRGRGGDKRVVWNGIDVTDVTRSFTDEEWDALRPNGGLAYIHQQRELLHGGGRGRGRDGRGRGRGRDSRNASALETETKNTTPQENERGARNGDRFGRGAYGQGRGGRS